jgi:hypothetical protein
VLGISSTRNLAEYGALDYPKNGIQAVPRIIWNNPSEPIDIKRNEGSKIIHCMVIKYQSTSTFRVLGIGNHKLQNISRMNPSPSPRPIGKWETQGSVYDSDAHRSPRSTRRNTHRMAIWDRKRIDHI